jgi:hypothetical protein
MHQLVFYAVQRPAVVLHDVEATKTLKRPAYVLKDSYLTRCLARDARLASS